MKHTPRPASRVLLAGRFVVARGALLARPGGPVNGLDLSRGMPVVLELLSAADGAALHARGEGRNVRRHRGGWVRATAPSTPPIDVAPAVEPAPAVHEAARLGALRRELRSRRVRLTGIAAVGVACALVAAGLLGGVRTGGAATARAASPPASGLFMPAAGPALVRPAVQPAPRVVPAVHAVARGGAARVLVVAPAAHPHRAVPAARVVATVHRAPTAIRSRAPVRSTGWVAGLFVGQ